MALPYDITKNPTFLGMEQAKGIIRDVATGRRIMGLICSDPGFAKTYNAKHIMRVENVPFHECSPTTESALVKVLWGIESGLITSKDRKPAVLLADDKDALFRRETANLLKSAFGSDRRSVSYDSPEAMKNEDRRNSENEREKAKYKATIPSPSFDVTVRFLGLANLNYTDPAVVAGLSTHFLPLVSKGLDPSWIPNDAEHDGRDVFLATHYLATEGKMLVSEGYPYWIARDAVEFYVRNVNRLIDIPPRRLSQIAYVIRHNADLAERERRLNDMLRSIDQRPKLILPESWVPVLLWPPDPPRRPYPPPPDPPPAASAPGPVELEPDPKPPPAASAPIPVEPDLEPDPDPPAAASAPGPVEPEPDPEPPPAASAPIPVEPDLEPDPDPPAAASAPGPVEPEPDPEPPPAASAPTSIAPEPLPSPGSQAEPPSRAAILQDTARMLRGRITQAMITGTAERLEINGYDEDRRVFIEAEWPAQPSIQGEFLLRLLGPAEAKEIRGFLAHNGTDLPKGHIPIREIKATQVKFKVHDIEWTFTCGREAKADLIAGARRAKVTRPWLGSCVQLHAVDGRIAFERSPFEFGFGDLEWALKKPWTSLSAARDGLVKMIVPGLLGNFVIYLLGCETGLAAEIERQRQMADVAELADRANLHQIDDAFDNYWSDDLPPEPPVASGLEPATTIQERPIKGLSPDVLERNCVKELDAILDVILPPGDSRQGAFLGAVEQVKAMNKNVDEPVLEFIRRMAIRPDRAGKLFEPDTTGKIINQAKAMMAWFSPFDPVRDPDPTPTIHQIANALSDKETAEVTRRYELRAFRGRPGELDVVAYHRRAAFLIIAGPKLTRDQVAIVHRKTKGFWQEMGAAEDLLAEMLNLPARDDVPLGSRNPARGEV